MMKPCFDWLAETLADTEGDLHNTAGHQVGAIPGLAATGKHHSWTLGFTTAAIFLANPVDTPLSPSLAREQSSGRM